MSSDQQQQDLALADFLSEAKLFLSELEDAQSRTYSYDFKADRPKTGGRMKWLDATSQLSSTSRSDE
jgi:hypothetical protein